MINEMFSSVYGIRGYNAVRYSADSGDNASSASEACPCGEHVLKANGRVIHPEHPHVNHVIGMLGDPEYRKIVREGALFPQSSDLASYDERVSRGY